METDRIVLCCDGSTAGLIMYCFALRPVPVPVYPYIRTRIPGGSGRFARPLPERSRKSARQARRNTKHHIIDPGGAVAQICATAPGKNVNRGELGPFLRPLGKEL